MNTLNFNFNTECVRDKSKKDINVEYENVSRENICCTVISFYPWFIKRKRFALFPIFSGFIAGRYAHDQIKIVLNRIERMKIT